MTQTKSAIKNSKLLYMYVALLLYMVGTARSKRVGGQGGVNGGSRGGTWKFPKLGATHRWMSVGGGGCTYVHTFLWYGMKYRSRPMGPEPTSKFFCQITEN